MGDWIETMQQWPDEFVQTVVTSPPYWGLRDYQEDGQLGLEKTPEEYLKIMVAGFRQIRRILRKDGTVFLNMGDCYAGGAGRWGKMPNGCKQITNKGCIYEQHQIPPGLKPKDKCGIPERFVLALQADGWWWRQTIIWHKPNPMPESVNGWRWERHKIKIEKSKRADFGYNKEAHASSQGRYNPNKFNDDLDGRKDGVDGSAEWQDCPGCPKCEPNDGLILSRGSGRPTTAHEYIYLLTKSDRYFYDTEAVREKAEYGFTPKPGMYERIGDAEKNPERTHVGSCPNGTGGSRNLRSVWTMATQACSFAHFATFPEELPNKCILAGTSPTACGTCGAPYAPVVERSLSMESGSGKAGNIPHGKHEGSEQAESGNYDIRMGPVVHSKVLAYRRTCPHDDPTGRCVVYDPFAGTNTVGYRAQELGRDWIATELSDKYAAYGDSRTAQQVMI